MYSNAHHLFCYKLLTHSINSFMILREQPLACVTVWDLK